MSQFFFGRGFFLVFGFFKFDVILSRLHEMLEINLLLLRKKKKKIMVI